MRQDQFGLVAPPAGLYDYSAEITAGIDGFDNVTDAEIEQFHALGFLVIHNAIGSVCRRDGPRRHTRSDSEPRERQYHGRSRWWVSASMSCPMKNGWTACAR